MYLREIATGDLVKVEDLDQLTNPNHAEVRGRTQAGQEEQDPAPFSKHDLAFPSGEALPVCWHQADASLKG